MFEHPQHTYWLSDFRFAVFGNFRHVYYSSQLHLLGIHHSHSAEYFLTLKNTLVKSWQTCRRCRSVWTAEICVLLL